MYLEAPNPYLMVRKPNSWMYWICRVKMVLGHARGLLNLR